MEIKRVYHDEYGVRRTLIAEDTAPDKFTVHTEVDLTQVLTDIKRDRDLQPAKSINKLVARVPMTVYEKSLVEQWDEGDWKKWLNDPDNCHFRVWQGRV